MKKLTFLVLLAITIASCNVDVKPTLKSSYLKGDWWTTGTSMDSTYAEIHFSDTKITLFDFEYKMEELPYKIANDYSKIIVENDSVEVTVLDKNSFSWHGFGGEIVFHRITDTKALLSDFKGETYEKLALIQQMRANRYVQNKEVGTDTLIEFETHIHYLDKGDTLVRDSNDVVHRMYKQDDKLIYEKLLFDVSDYVEGETNWYEQLKGREEELAKILIREELPEI